MGGAALFLGVSSVENEKPCCTSHQGVSRNGPWERLAWTQDAGKGKLEKLYLARNQNPSRSRIP